MNPRPIGISVPYDTWPPMRIIEKKGLVSKVATEVIENAKKNPNFLVLAADIDFDNMFSKKVFERLGFTERTRFCWGAGQKPADILHYVKFPPQADGKSC